MGLIPASKNFLRVALASLSICLFYCSRSVSAIEIDTTGYLKNETAIRLDKTHEYTKILNMAQLEIKYRPFSAVELVTIGRAYYDSVYDVERLSVEVAEKYEKSLAVRELYLDLFLDNADIRIGKQQVVWGEVLGQRITDVINPLDLKEFILDDFIDSRIPLWLLKIDYYLYDLTLEGVWIPDFEPGKLAEEDSEWEFTFNQDSDSSEINIDLRDTVYPQDGYEDSEWGVKLKGFYQGCDWSASYFSTWDDTPTIQTRFKLKNFQPTLVIRPKYNRLAIWGVTLAKPFNDTVISCESAYYQDKYFITADQKDRDGNVLKDYLHYAVGAEYTPSSQLAVNGQFVQRVILDYDPDIEEHMVINNYSVYLRSNFLHETLKPEILVVYTPDGFGSWLNPKIKYSLTDAIGVSLGADILGGDDDHFFGQFDDNDRITSELKYSF